MAGVGGRTETTEVLDGDLRTVLLVSESHEEIPIGVDEEFCQVPKEEICVD